MAFAAIAGLGVGALHAVAGPDHVLSLAPLSVGRRRGAWRLGFRWGVGHAVGTLAAAMILIFAVEAIDLQGAERWGERVAGLALIAMGLWGLRRLLRPDTGSSRTEERGVFLVGLVHGVSGAAALLLLLPAIVSGAGWFRALYLAGFSVGSTVAMAALTAGLAACSLRGRVGAFLQGRVPAVASTLSVALGSFWIASSL